MAECRSLFEESEGLSTSNLDGQQWALISSFVFQQMPRLQKEPAVSFKDTFRSTLDTGSPQKNFHEQGLDDPSLKTR